jgi:hypothetical protein
VYVGPARIGESVSVVFQSRTQALAPVAADDLPTYRVYDGTTLVTTGTCAAFDSGNVTGAYRAAITATTAAGFARGRTYTVVGLWEVSGGARQEIACFTCV